MVTGTAPHRTGHSHVLRDVAEAFFRHKKKAALFGISIVALATLVILYAPRKYRSEARLFLQVGRESVRLDPTATTGEMIGLQQSGRDNEVATAMEVLRSRAIYEQTVDKLSPEVVLGHGGSSQAEPNPVADYGLAPLRFLVRTIKSIDPISKREEAIIAIEKNFKVDAEHDSTLLVLTYDAETARLSQEILATLVDVFRDAHAKLHRTSGSKSFFVAQRDGLQKQLAEAEDALREAKSRMGLASIISRRNTVETRLSSVELNRNTTIQAIEAAEAKREALRLQLQELPERVHSSTRVMPNTGADSLRAQLYTLQVKLLELEAKYNADHPMVVATRQQADEAKLMLKDEVVTRQETVDSVNVNHRALSLDLAQTETSLAGLKAQLAELARQRDAALEGLKQLNDFEIELEQLERSVKLAHTNFFRYSADLEEARIDEELNSQRIINVAVAQDATQAEKPVSPSKLLIGALSFLLLTAGTTALVLGSERFDSRMHTEDQVEHVLRLPVFAAVPEGRAYGAAPAARVNY